MKVVYLGPYPHIACEGVLFLRGEAKEVTPELGAKLVTLVTEDRPLFQEVVEKAAEEN